MGWTKSLHGRLIIALMIVFLLGGVNVIISLFDMEKDLRSHIMNKQLDMILDRVPIATSSDIARLPLRYSEADWSYTLYDASGVLLISAPAGAPPLPPLSFGKQRISGQLAQVARQTPAGQMLVVAKDDVLERGELREIIGRELAGGSVLILCLGGLSFLAMFTLAKWTLRSVSRAAALAGTIGVESSKRRIPLDDLPSEIVPLAAAANGALDKLANAYVAERRFTADAAHELRTPLAILSLRIQKARMEAQVDWAPVERDMFQMKRLVDQLMALARVESHADLSASPNTVSLSRVVRLAAADMMLLFEQAGREISVEVPCEMFTIGQEGQLRQAVQNLLENALVHGQGKVSICLRQVRSDMLMLEVADEGPAPGPDEREEWFQRFRKGRQSAPGSGLGLSIVRQIARNLKGDVEIAEKPSFTVQFIVPSAPKGIRTARDRHGD